jgi:hypothetical protein
MAQVNGSGIGGGVDPGNDWATQKALMEAGGRGGSLGFSGALPSTTATRWNPQPLNIQSNVADYNFGATPTISTTPWNPLGAAGFSTDSPQVGPTQYDAQVEGGPYMIGADSGLDVNSDYGLNAWVQAISDQLNAAEPQRVEAAAEAAAARGMSRSGGAILSEDAVRRETDLEIAKQTAAAAVQQATLTQDTMKAAATLRTEREISNQRAAEAWQQLTEQAEQYYANLEQQKEIANQQAYIEMSGQARDYAAQLSQLETQRVISNQSASLAMKEMESGYNQFLKELDFQSQVAEAENSLGYSQLGEDARWHDQQAAISAMSAMGSGGGSQDIPWPSMTSDVISWTDIGMPPEQRQTAFGASYPDYYGDLAQTNPDLYKILIAAQTP